MCCLQHLWLRGNFYISGVMCSFQIYTCLYCKNEYNLMNKCWIYQIIIQNLHHMKPILAPYALQFNLISFFKVLVLKIYKYIFLFLLSPLCIFEACWDARWHHRNQCSEPEQLSLPVSHRGTQPRRGTDPPYRWVVLWLHVGGSRSSGRCSAERWQSVLHQPCPWATE